MDRWDIPIREDPQTVSETLTPDEIVVGDGDPSEFRLSLTSNKVTFVNRDGVVKVKELEDSK